MNVRVLVALGLGVALASGCSTATSPPSAVPSPPSRAAPLPTGAATLPSARPATDGTIYTDKLFLGVLALEDSPLALDATQATGVLRVLDKLDRKLVRNQYYDDALEGLLTEAQRQRISSLSRHIDESRMRNGLNPTRLQATVADLEALAGVRRPVEPLEAPTGTVVRDRDLGASRMSLFIVAWPDLQANRDTAATAVQAEALLPFVASYVGLKSMKQQTKADILALLTAAQKSRLDVLSLGDSTIHDMTLLTRQLRDAMMRNVGAGG